MPAPVSKPPSSSSSSPVSTSTSPPDTPTCAASSLPTSEALLRKDINRRLLESGELEKLSNHLALLLRESGWREQTLQSCNRALRDPELKVANYAGLYAAVERDCVEGVDPAVKVEIVKRIREVLEAMVEV